MKNKLARIAVFALIAAAMVAVPAATRAADPTNAPAKEMPPVAKRSLPFHGKIASVETNAMTFTVGKTTLAVTSSTKIFKDGKPAVFADIAVGEYVSGSYKKDDAGQATTTMVRIGAPTPKGEAPKPETPAPAEK